MLILAGAVAGPAVLSPHLVDVGTLAGLYATAAAGLTVLMGYAGQVSFGQGAFFAVGAYTVGILTVKAHLPGLLALGLAPLVCALAAVLVGWPLLRLRGHHLAVATLALAIITVEVLVAAGDLTGGSVGLAGLPALAVAGEPLGFDGFFTVSWVAALLALAFVRNLQRSRPGRALRSIGASEPASEALGVPTSGYRLRAFVLSAVMAAVAGALYALNLQFLSPDAFEVSLSVLLLLIAVLGGLSSPYGALVGSVAVVALQQWLTTLGQNPNLPPRLPVALNTLVYGAIIIIVMRYLPQGLLPALSAALARAWRAVARSRPAAEQPVAPPSAVEEVHRG